jgi:UDP-N-acetylglucosamine--N-acetylmuramyl-(pentapeptide) pyrophosphoryl-undecaprenol N-acetylglucosamine transferase
MSSSKILISGGGTGGHIFPGLSIAHWLKKLNPELQIIFVGSQQGLEKQIIPQSGYELLLVRSAQLNDVRSPLKKIKAVIELSIGVIQSCWLLQKHRPQYVLGVGGYASVPMMVASCLLRFPRAIWEPNSRPGLANQFLSRWIPKSFLVFEESKQHLHTQVNSVLGMPTRPDIEEQVAKNEKSQLKLVSEKFHVFHYGGSQGARSIGEVLSRMIVKYSSQLQNFRFVHQCGPKELERFKKAYENSPELVECFSFIQDMPKYYSWADLVIARGGASTLNELAAYGKPSLIIPLPLADDHQEKNARALTEKNAAVMMLQKDLNEDSLFEFLINLSQNLSLRESLAREIRKFYQPKAAQAIAQEILDEVAHS